MPNLRPGDVIRYPDASLWLVTWVSPGSAAVTAITGYKAKIVTRQGKVAEIWRRRPNHYIAPNSGVEVLESALAQEARRKYKMSTTETPETAPTEATVRQKRPTQSYIRTKQPRPERLTGQGLQVLEAIESIDGSFTSEDVLTKTTGQFKTRQPEDRIVAYYLAKFKRQGLLVVEGGQQYAAPASEVPDGGEPTEDAE